MPRHADFPVPVLPVGAVGPTFTLGGQRFTCLPVMPAGAFMSLPETLAGQVVEAGPFILACLVESDEDRFRAALADKAALYQPFDLMAILRWLLNEAWLDAEPEAPAPAPAEPPDVPTDNP